MQLVLNSLPNLPKVTDFKVWPFIKKGLSILARVFLFLLVQLISTCFNPSVAQDIYDLARSNDVEIIAWLGADPEVEKPQVSVNEQLILYVEVATPRWFTGGTRIGMIEIPNVIVKQRNTLATNYHARKDGQTWSRQRWEVTLYPMETGEYAIPPIAVDVEVSAPNREKVGGTLYTTPMKFEVQLPVGTLTDDSVWFAASDVSVSQKWNVSNEELKVGDAINRTLTIEAQDTLSVLLPKLLDDKSTKQYQTYLQPRELDDTQSRGNYRSISVEEGVHVAQEGGEFTFPAVTFEWWNTETNTLEKVTIEGETFKISHTPLSFLKAHRTLITTLFIVTVLLILGAILGRRHLKARLESNNLPEIVQLLTFIHKKQWGAARTHLYKQLRLGTSLLEMTKLKGSERWQENAQAMQQGQDDISLLMKIRKAILQSRQGKRRKLFALPKALPQLNASQNARTKKAPSVK